MKSRKKKWMLLYVLCGSTFFASLNQNIYSPIIPLIRDSFDVSLHLVNASIGLFIFVIAVLQIVYGAIIDFYNQRTVILIGLWIAFLASIVCAFTSDFSTFLLFRVLQAIGVAAIPLIAVNMIGAAFSGKEQGSGMATYQILLSLAPAVAPVIGGFIGQWFGYRGVFSFLSIISAILLVILFIVFPKEQKKMRNKLSIKAIANHYKGVLTGPIAPSIFLLTFLIFFIYFDIAVLLPVLLTDGYHFTLNIVGLLYLPLTVSMIGGSVLFKYTQSRISLAKLFQMVGFIMSLLIFLFSILHHHSIIGLCLVLFGYGITMGIVPPLFSTLISQQFKENRGSALGLFNFVRYGGMVLGSMLPAMSFHSMHVGIVFFILGMFLLIASVIGGCCIRKMQDVSTISQNQLKV